MIGETHMKNVNNPQNRTSVLALVAIFVLGNTTQPANAGEQCFTLGAAQFTNAIHY